MNGTSSSSSNGGRKHARPSSGYGRHSLFARVATALTTKAGSVGSSNNDTKDHGGDDEDADTSNNNKAKYTRKGRSRRRLHLTLQQQTALRYRIMVLIAVAACASVVSMGTLIVWNVFFSNQVQHQQGDQDQLHHVPYFHHHHSLDHEPLQFIFESAASKVRVIEDRARAWEELIKPLWVDDGAEKSAFESVLPNMQGNAVTRTNFLAYLFGQQRHKNFTEHHLRHQLLPAWLYYADQQVIENLHAGIQWIPAYLLPSLDGDISDAETDVNQAQSTHCSKYGFSSEESPSVAFLNDRY
jgi:hypothetical protein